MRSAITRAAWLTAPCMLGRPGSSFATEAVHLAPLGAGEALQVLIGLILVLAVMVGLAWCFRRWGAARSTAGGMLKVLGALSLGSRERIVVVQVDAARLVLGVSHGHICKLHVLADDNAAPSSGRAPESGFQELLSGRASTGVGS